jgi:hypothetical protein
MPRSERGMTVFQRRRDQDERLWNTGPPGPVYAKASTRLAVFGAPKL